MVPLGNYFFGLFVGVKPFPVIDKIITCIYNVYVFEWDEGHSQDEDRYFCVGRIPGGIVTVRFAIRENRIRIIGAGFWREGRKEYEQRN